MEYMNLQWTEKRPTRGYGTPRYVTKINVQKKNVTIGEKKIFS